VRYHSVGCATWERVGQALYMADYLEPGRSFARRDRAFLAQLVPTKFEDVLRQVIRVRIETTIRDGFPLLPDTVAFWNANL